MCSRLRSGHRPSCITGRILLGRLLGSCRLAAGRPGCHQDPEPAPRLRRQPVLGKSGQDPEVPTRVPGTLRLDLRMHPAFASTSFPGITPSTITAASACSRPKCSIAAGRRSHQPTPSYPQPGFRTESRTLRPGASPTTGTAYRRVDQSAARAGGNLTGPTLIHTGRCLKVIDKFQRRGSGRSPLEAY